MSNGLYKRTGKAFGKSSLQMSESRQAGESSGEAVIASASVAIQCQGTLVLDCFAPNYARNDEAGEVKGGDYS
jgi:hypothetical protein